MIDFSLVVICNVLFIFLRDRKFDVNLSLLTTGGRTKHNCFRKKLLKVDDMDLFNPNILERVVNELQNDEFIFRPLNSEDYDKGFLQLLSQLTEVGENTKDQFLNRFYGMKSSGGYYVIVLEDASCGKIVGSATLVVEQKFIHNCGVRGHLEDVVVNSNYRGKHLGKRIVTVVKKLAQSLKCYKITLNCRDSVLPFYETLGFKRELENSSYLLVRFSEKDYEKQP